MPEPEDNPLDSHWTRLIEVSRCNNSGGTFVDSTGKELAVFVLGPDEVSVIDNACPHAGGNLAGGDVSEGVVTCPWHQWQFNLATGLCLDSPAARVAAYPSRVRNGWVEIKLGP